MQDDYPAVLQELIELSMQVARAIAARAEKTPTLELVESFERVARAVRNAVILKHRLVHHIASADRPTNAHVQAMRDMRDTLRHELAEPGRFPDPDTATRH